MGTVIDNFYTRASGTSMATPHAAGACALLLQVKPDLTPQQVKDILMGTAKNLNLDPNTQGTGRAQVFLAYQVAIGAEPMPTPPPTPTPTPTPTPPGDGCFEAIKSLLSGR
jgi:serine protease AprX